MRGGSGRVWQPKGARLARSTHQNQLRPGRGRKMCRGASAARARRARGAACAGLRGRGGCAQCTSFKRICEGKRKNAGHLCLIFPPMGGLSERRLLGPWKQGKTLTVCTSVVDRDTGEEQITLFCRSWVVFSLTLQTGLAGILDNAPKMRNVLAA